MTRYVDLASKGGSGRWMPGFSLDMLGEEILEGILLAGDLRRGAVEYNSGRTAVTVNDGRPIPARVKQAAAIIGGAWTTQDRSSRRVPFTLRNVARLLFGKTTGDYQREAKRALAELAWLRFRFDNPDGSAGALTFGKVRWDRNGQGVFTIEEEIHRLLLDRRYQSIPIQLASLPYNRFDLWNEALLQPRTALVGMIGQWQDYNIGPEETITLERLGLAGFEHRPGDLRKRLEAMASEGNERQSEWHLAILDRSREKGLKARLTRLSLPVKTDAALVRTDAVSVKTDAAIEIESGPVDRIPDRPLDGLSPSRLLTRANARDSTAVHEPPPRSTSLTTPGGEHKSSLPECCRDAERERLHCYHHGAWR